jgi:hypothetical protein
VPSGCETAAADWLAAAAAVQIRSCEVKGRALHPGFADAST